MQRYANTMKRSFVVLSLLLGACQGSISHPDDPGQFHVDFSDQDSGMADYDGGVGITNADYDAGPHWSRTVNGDMPFFTPGVALPTMDVEPWVNGSLPLKFTIDPDVASSRTVVLDILQAVEIINDTAGGIVLQRVDKSDPYEIMVNYGSLPAGAGAWTHCSAHDDPVQLCYVTSTVYDITAFKKNDLGVAVWVHEFMHSLGYYAADGDIHDEGVMAPGITYFDITPRQRAYLNELGKKARGEFLSPDSGT